MASRPGEVRTLGFSAHVYEDHTIVTVGLAKAYPPRQGTRRLGSVRLPLGRDVLAGMDSTDAVILVARALLEVMSPSTLKLVGR